MRRPVLFLVPALIVSGLLLAGCNDGSVDASQTPKPSATSTAPVPTVTGAFGERPTLELPSGSPSDKLVAKVLDAGDGETTSTGDLVIANYSAWVWRADKAAVPSPSPTTDPTDGGSFDTTFGKGVPVTFPLTDGQLLPGMINGLLDKTVGSRVLVVVPPAQGFGADGQSQLGVGPNDALVFVFDVLAAYTGDAAADGSPVALDDPALPAVSAASGAEGADAGPVITIPAGVNPPTQLVTKVLLQGNGDTVGSGQLVIVQYRGVLWKDGSEFDSSWSRNQPTGFPIGVGSVIPGWDKAIVGQQVGSRLLLVVPPADGYGAEGDGSGKITGTDTLVFVIDILGAYGTAT